MLRIETFTGVALGNMLDSFIVGGIGTFLPAFVETQFHVSAADASFFSGLAIILGVTTGNLFGGWLVRRLNLTAKQTALALVVSSVLTLAFLTMFMVTCSTLTIAGIGIAYPEPAPRSMQAAPSARTSSLLDVYGGSGRGNETPLWIGCDASCHCSLRDFRAVCHRPTGVTFLTPCAAGCTTELPELNAYGNCSCVVNLNHTTAAATTTSPSSSLWSLGGAGQRTAVNGSDIVHVGQCKGGCTSLPLFLVLMFLGMFFLFVPSVPITQVHLRCVPEEQRSLALGTAHCIARLFGAVPGPVVVGALLDHACILWEDRCDNTRGACLAYDNPSMALRLGLAAAAAKGLSVVVYAWGWIRFPAHRDGRFQTEKHEVVILQDVSSSPAGTQTEA